MDVSLNMKYIESVHISLKEHRKCNLTVQIFLKSVMGFKSYYNLKLKILVIFLAKAKKNHILGSFGAQISQTGKETHTLCLSHLN